MVFASTASIETPELDKELALASSGMDRQVIAQLQLVHRTRKARITGFDRKGNEISRNTETLSYCIVPFSRTSRRTCSTWLMVQKNP
jgi:hypothetical protein